ncbi:MAG TPA: creatininase family protein [Gemmatimonadales bacterium]|nr:creatininase family protein [Gemmatimonadales bacterium]
MPVHELAQLTWEDVRDLDRTRTVVMLPVGALEAHGPHLPLDSDVVIATAMARAGAKKLSARGHVVLMLPALAYTAARFGAGFHGTLSISGVTVTALIVDLARSLSDQEFRLLAIANAHLDPEHLTALHEAVKLARADGLVPIIFPDLTRKPWGSRLGDEFKSGACHAGQFESSIVLSEQPDRVRNDVRRSLKANPASLSEAIKAGKRTFSEAGGARAYFGDPAAASAEEGRRTIGVLGGILEEAVLAEIGQTP